MATPQTSSQDPGLLIPQRQTPAPYRRRGASDDVLAIDVAERLKYEYGRKWSSQFEGRGGLATCPDLMVVFDMTLQQAVKGGHDKASAIQLAQAEVSSIASSIMSLPTPSQHPRALGQLHMVTQHAQSLQALSEEDFMQSAMFPTSPPPQPGFRPGPAASVTGVLSSANAPRMAGMVRADETADKVVYKTVVSPSTGETFRFHAANRVGDDVVPTPTFFMDMVLFDIREQMAGQPPGSILSQLSIELADTDGNVYASFRKNKPKEAAAATPANVTFVGDE